MEFGGVFENLPMWLQLTLYSVAVLAISIFGLGIVNRFSIWASGRDEDEVLKGVGALGLLRLSVTRFVSKDCFFARRLFARSTFRGTVLLLIVWGIIILFVGAFFQTVDYYFRLGILTGMGGVVYRTVTRLAGLALLTGVSMALVRRYQLKPGYLVTYLEDGVVLTLLMSIILLGYAIEGVYLPADRLELYHFSPMGFLFANLYTVVFRLDPQMLQTVYMVALTSHISLAMVFIAYIPFSKMLHIYAAQITTSLASSRYGGVVSEKR